MNHGVLVSIWASAWRGPQIWPFFAECTSIRTQIGSQKASRDAGDIDKWSNNTTESRYVSEFIATFVHICWQYLRLLIMMIFWDRKMMQMSELIEDETKVWLDVQVCWRYWRSLKMIDHGLWHINTMQTIAIFGGNIPIMAKKCGQKVWSSIRVGEHHHLLRFVDDIEGR